jgi:hypothetical protein
MLKIPPEMNPSRKMMKEKTMNEYVLILIKRTKPPISNKPITGHKYCNQM